MSGQRPNRKRLLKSLVLLAGMRFPLTSTVYSQVNVPSMAPSGVGTQDITDPKIGDGLKFPIRAVA
jgi:hypothetical protein